MSLICLLLLLASPGTIRVQVQGGEAEIWALRDGVLWARAATQNRIALLEGLAGGAYDLVARGSGRASPVERGVRTVHDGRPGADARLVLAAAYPVRIETSPGSMAWSDGLLVPVADLRLRAGLRGLVLDHPERVSSPTQLLRVAGPVRLSLPLEPGLVVLGRVVDRRGRPVPGARVEVFSDGWFTGRAVLTDSSGNFGLSGFRGKVVSLRARAIGYAATLSRVVFYPGAERARIEVVLRPGSGVTLEANTRVTAVLLPGWYEQALEQPRLRANHAPARRTGLRVGFFSLTPGRRYRMLLSAPGHEPTASAPFRAPAAGHLLVLPRAVLPVAASLRGSVKGGGAGLIVACRGPEGTNTCRTDRVGRFEFPDLDAGRHELFILNRDHKARRVELERGQSLVHDLEFPSPDPGRALQGVVMDADGRPLDAVMVSTAGRSTLTNESGEFRITGLPVGRELYSVGFVPGPDCRALVQDPHLPHTEKRVHVGAQLQVPLERAGRLRLRFDTGGRPLSRATVLISRHGGRTLRRSLPRRARGVEIGELALGSYEVTVAAPGFLAESSVLPVRRGEPQAHVLRLVSGRKVSGRLVLRRVLPGRKTPLNSDKPIARGWVSLFDADPSRALATTPVEEDGSFVLEGLPLQNVVLVGGAPGLPVTALELDLVQADREGITLALRRGVEATVICTGEAEKPLPQARVRIQAMLRPDFGLDIFDLAALGRFRRVVAGESDLDEIERCFRLARTAGGRISALLLTPGSYRFLISAPGYQSVQVGVRARTQWQTDQIRRNVGNLPGGPDDLTPHLRLAPKRPDRKAADPGD